MTAVIRTLQQQDMEQVLRIWLEASVAAHDFVDGTFWESKLGDMRDIYLPLAESYVYEEAGTIRGFISLLGETLAAIFVSPAEQGKGIGRQLILKAKDVRDQLELTVYKANTRSTGFYRQSGFSVAQEKIDKHTAQPELLMCWRKEDLAGATGL